MGTNRYTVLPHEVIDRQAADLNVDFYLYLTGGERGVVFGHPEDGYLFIASTPQQWCVRHIYIFPHRRGEGLSRTLLDSADQYCREQRMEFLIYLTYNDDYTREFLDRYVREKEMTPCVPTRLYIINFEDLNVFQNAGWQKMLKRMQTLTRMWEAEGAVTTTFDQCPEEVLHNLKALYYETDVEKFQVSSDIYPFIADRYDPLSFITYKDTEPMAFAFCQRFGDSILFAGNLVLKKYSDTGCFALPMYRLIQGIEEDRSIRKMTFRVIGSNHPAMLLAERLWAHANPRIVRLQVFKHLLENA